MAAWSPLGVVSLLSSVGLGFLLQVEYLFPITGLFLLLAVGALLLDARNRRGYKPFWLGLAGAATILVAKFVFDQQAVMFAGLAALVTASLWHSWPKAWTRVLFKRH